ncbi:UDP-N-acetylmuramoyl-L-alanine--D-glutamate ligase [Marivibrio halodurans]|uniref:UDP-N-acetylmuramoylalanine--D-glutamate ligase n=1 Tax=Marivibrio halodurans TaxID=2039722 RepID=A0A8J7V2V3_9PROT|nr:UDP-N-acetylmuramoyl-L-alanine--D-glutamate ligase [Marivibrio halodurans]MBP5857730.1 UDP-N-acetylmuramoyl-L-alanine--D-glutamate ligase [Marivibrio halodurans]
MTIPVDIFRGQRTQILGMARSGLAAARALREGAAEVLCWDDSEAGRAAAEGAGFPLADPTRPGGFQDVAALIPAPGIPLTHPAPHPAIAKAKAEGVPVLGDVELLLRQKAGTPAIGITGTNGKSTTTALIGHMLTVAGHRAEVGGNLGTAALALAPLESGEGAYVLEMSSYQLDLIDRGAFDIGVFLNVTPDHLDRHGGLDGYIAAKRRMFRNDKPGGVAIVAVDDAHTRRLAADLVAAGTRRLIPVSAERPCPGGVHIDGAKATLIDDIDGAARAVLPLADCPALPGRHNWQNAVAAYAACRMMGLDAAQAAAGLKSFPGLAHRQERVGRLAGALCINDSKATNVEAAAKALASYDRIYWIAGGRAKEGGFDALPAHLGAVRHAFLIGEAADALDAVLSAHVPTTRSGDLETAVAQASTLAGEEGGTGAAILLSPACASFDQFKDFEQRGDAFRAIVARLADQEGGA